MKSSELTVSVRSHVATVEIHRAPNNHFDPDLIEALAAAYENLGRDQACRAILLCSEGKHFCAGANFQDLRRKDPANEKQAATLYRANELQVADLYRNAVRLFRTSKPVVAAVQGAAVGGGLGLAMSADFRVTCEEARFCANFARLGFHQGFGLSVTLARAAGNSAADLMLYTGRRVKGADAVAMGLADYLVPLAEVRSAALTLAQEIATSAPLAVQAIRRTRRDGLADEVASATDHELAEQTRLRDTEDFKEGLKAMAERRRPDFRGS